MLVRRAFCAAAFAAVAGFAAQPQNMGGSWKLNLDKSKWGKRDKPTSIELNIEHNEPSIRYHGTVINADATDRRDFKFDGNIDGKGYPADGPDGPGTMTISRVNPYSTRATFRSNDGKIIEESTTTISRDAKELTRRIHRKTPAGEFDWTEVYDKTS
jgi:hypothetical protein